MCDVVSSPAGLDDHALAASIAECARIENATAGHRLAAIAELAVRRLGAQRARDRAHMKVDGWASCAAEVAAELVIGPRTASSLVHQALDLRFRLSRIGELLRQGRIPLRVATAVCYRTMLILDEDLLARVDVDLAEAATRWGNYSQKSLTAAIDSWVARHDPDAVRRFQYAEKTLGLTYGARGDDPGIRSVRGRMSVINADLLERRVAALAATVCADDPRTREARRDDAYGIVAVGGDRLPCLCGTPDCPAAGRDPRTDHIDILILTDNPDGGHHTPADPPTPDDPDDGGPDDDGPGDGEDSPDGPRPGHTIWPDEYDVSLHWYDAPYDDDTGEFDQSDAAPTFPEPDVEPDGGPAERGPAPCQYTSITTGGAVIPAPLLHHLRMIGVAARTVTAAEIGTETRYRPSAAHQRLVRARDVTCCFIGCDRPAQYCDIDHTRPYGTSLLTHPGNTKALCRHHHLMKTFWVGEGGWSDEQLPDGTIVWTTPSGRRHRSPPRSRIHFPNWDTTTPLPPDAPPPQREQSTPAPGRDLRMPTRPRTRAEQHLRDVTAEREWRNRASPGDPPPF